MIDLSPRHRVVIAVAAVIALALAGWLVVRLQQLESQVAELGEDLQATEERAQAAEDQARASAQRAERAEQRADTAEASADDALSEAADAERRSELSDAARRTAELDALVAEQTAERAEEETVAALAEAARIRAERDRELARMEQALGAIAETRRTALGLVMNLGEESINFAFDRAELQPEDRELLSRIVGVLLTSSDYRIQVFGHTDDVGSESYNQGLSERRADAVADYLVEAGIDPEIITRRGYGMSKPLVEGTSEQARARNRRVELGIIDSTVRYEGRAGQQER